MSPLQGCIFASSIFYVQIGAPKTLAQTALGWSPRPSEAGAAIHARDGLWHAGLPECLVRVVVLRRQGELATKQPGHSKLAPTLAVFFTTALFLRAEESARAYGHRWAVEIAIRDRNAFAGLGQEQCRPRGR